MSQFPRAAAAFLLACATVIPAAAQTQVTETKPAEPLAKPTADFKLSEAQKRDILASEDDIFRFASADTGLALKHPVKVVFFTRDQINKELRRKFDEDKSNKRMERSELVLKKFGLLDRDFQLRPFLLSLLTEQIAGFYDNKAKTMTLLDWVPLEQQKPVMAHELTHALQDQKVGISKWQDTEPEGMAKTFAEDNAHISTDEVGTAREAVLEGQAMVSFADYLLRPSGKTLKDMPQVGDQLQSGAGDQSDSPVLARAPLVLQQAMLFPYTAGLAFEQEILVQTSAGRAFSGVLDNPPNTSSEIMHPDAYLAHQPVPSMRLPDIHPTLLRGGWEPYDVGVMGELDVRMTAELFGGRPLAEALAPNWAGGVYYAAQKKDASPSEKATTKSIALLYSSHWKNSDSARSFFEVFEQELPRQYDGLKRRKADEADDSERVFSSREGDILLTLREGTVWVSEGFDLATARQLRKQVDDANLTSKGPVMNASTSLTGQVSRYLNSFGMMKAALPTVATPTSR